MSLFVYVFRSMSSIKYSTGLKLFEHVQGNAILHMTPTFARSHFFFKKILRLFEFLKPKPKIGMARFFCYF